MAAIAESLDDYNQEMASTLKQNFQPKISQTLQHTLWKEGVKLDQDLSVNAGYLMPPSDVAKLRL